MPRSRGGRSTPARAPSAPSRVTAPAPPPRSMANQQQTRAMTTTAPTAPPQAGAQQRPGRFSEMATNIGMFTAASALGNMIGDKLTDRTPSSSSDAQQPQQSAAVSAQPMDNGLYNSQSQTALGGYGGNGATSAQDQFCAGDAKSFAQCMNENSGNLTTCSWYLEQLKACQEASKPY